MERKKIIVCSPGDADDLATWSNVPHFFCETLRKKFEYEVINVDISLKNSLKNRILWHLINGLKKTITCIQGTNIYNFNRSRYYDFAIEKIMKKAEKNYADADAEIVFDFSHTISSKIPQIMICDWTIEYYIKEHLKRSPRDIEKKLIKNQYNKMRCADVIIPIFSYSAQLIKEKFPQKTYYLGHIVNCEEKFNENDVCLKQTSKEVLFIGKPAYLEGLLQLIEAISLMQKEVRLNVIGMSGQEISENVKGKRLCKFWGYLNKSDDEQRKQYYKLIRSARVVVNTTNAWNGASSLFEALYLGTPVIVSRNKELETMIGDEEPFCTYCEAGDANALKEILDDCFEMETEEMIKVSMAANQFASKFTWEEFCDKFDNVLAHLKCQKMYSLI